MPRHARLDAPGALQHIIVRGIERRRIFRDDHDRDAFVRRLGRVLRESGTPCYAWALMPNHAHVLVRTGRVPIARVMARLLTGYAVAFNRRHRRHGPLFQNRYKSILCEEEPYLLELVRYIHLNPLRGGQVESVESLGRFPYAGHSALMGSRDNEWQVTDFVLRQFAQRTPTARRAYLAFVEAGVARGRRPELVGGGLVRRVGGWTAARSLKRGGERIKGDERILGESAFVLTALEKADEELSRAERIRRRGVDLASTARQAAAAFGLTEDLLSSRGQARRIVAARSVFCYWAVRELAQTTTLLAQKLGLTQPAVSIAVRRGERIAQEMGLRLAER
jgi:REP element-mobilizing transposase RayT